METLLIEKHGHITVLKLNRPQAYNALNTAMLRELSEVADEFSCDKDIRVLIITGVGKAFAAGADIKEMELLSKDEGSAFADAGHLAFRKIDDLYMPVMAAINGYALGGGLELALCCDIRFAARSARFGQPETSLGIIPGFGGTQRLPRVIGTSPSLLLAYTAKQIDSAEAKRLRIVNDVFDDDKLMEAAFETAEQIAKNAPRAVHMCKLSMSRRFDRFLDEDLHYEAQSFGDCFDTQDQRMAMRAFLEKRPHDEFKGE